MAYITKIKKKSTGTVYDFSPLNITSQVVLAQEAAARANAAAVAAQGIVSGTSNLIGGKDIPYFSESDTYLEGDLVYYKDTGDEEAICYRCEVSSHTGPWVAASFTESSLYQEIRKISRDDYSYGTVKVKLSFSDNKHAINNLTVQLSYGQTVLTAITDSNGIATFVNIPKGTTYAITPPDMTSTTGLEGESLTYQPKKVITNVVNVKERLISVIYHTAVPGVYIIWSSDNVEVKETPLDNWDGSNNSSVKAICLRVTMSGTVRNLCVSPNTIFTGKAWATSTGGASAASVSTNDNYGTNDTYNNGAAMGNMMVIIQWLITNSIISLGATEEEIQTALNTYFPAFGYCYSKTLSIAGQTIRGYLPAKNELDVFAGKSSRNLTQINAALRAVGGRMIVSGADISYLSSGNFWMSTQNSNLNAWYLNGGTPNGNIKTNQYQALPFFDLSIFGY